MLTQGWHVRVLLGAAAVIVILAAPAANAQQAPITVEADIITYDSARQVVTAEGNVRLTGRRYRIFADAARYDLRAQIAIATGRVRIIDDQGRELRGHSLTYNILTDEGILEPSEGIIDRERRIFMRADRVEFSPQRMVTHQSFVTTCEPERPLVHVTARRIEIVPEEALVAHDASVFLAGRRLYSTPRFVVSLVPGEEGVLVPGFGYGGVDGFWVDYRARVRFADARGSLHTKYGTESGAFALLTLVHRDPAYTTALRLGRTQTRDDLEGFNLMPFTVAEVQAESAPIRLAQTPFSWSVAGAAGWFDDERAVVSTTRLNTRLAVQSGAIPLAPQWSLRAGASFRASAYGTGAVRTVVGVDVDLAYAVDAQTRVTLGYTLRGVGGASPLLVDNVDRESTVRLAVARTLTDRYRASASIAHNTFLAETKVTGTLAYIVSPTFEFAVSAVYNARLAKFEDIDYTLRGICDCVDVVVRYRQIRREVSIEFGLLGFVERGAPFVPRSTTRLTLPDGAGSRPEGGDLH
jgi:LPS-assembly protein